MSSADCIVCSRLPPSYLEISSAEQTETLIAELATKWQPRELFIFEVLEVERVELQYQADNLASKRLAERCGFTHEGRMRQWHRNKDSRLVDVLWFGLLREEWESGRAPESS